MARSLLGRTLDLEGAYKLLARHPEDSDELIFAVWSLDNKRYEFYEAVALPFGAIGSEYYFNGEARALRRILVVVPN